MKSSYGIGSRGEQMACDFLQSMGHHILDRNWRGGHLEVDIVSEAPDGIHFVEVKSLSGRPMYEPREKVDYGKRKRITTAANRYIHTRSLDGKEIFFDVVSVVIDGAQARLKYYPQAWIPMNTYY